jgi:hypothetical protein
MYLNLHLKFLLSRSKQQGILQSSKKFETARLARNPLVWYSLLDGNEDLVTNVEFVCRLCYKFTCKIWNCAPYFDIINPKTFFERCPYKNLWIVLFSYQKLKSFGSMKTRPLSQEFKTGLLLLMFTQCDVWKATHKFGQNLYEPGPITTTTCLKTLSTALQGAVESTFNLKATMFNLKANVQLLIHCYK